MDQTIEKNEAAEYPIAHDLSSIAHVATQRHDGDSIERAVQNALEACGIVILDSDACSVTEHGGSEQSQEDSSSHDDGNSEEEHWSEEENSKDSTESKPDSEGEALVIIDNKANVCQKSTSELCQPSKSVKIDFEQTSNDCMSEEVSAQNIQNESNTAGIGEHVSDLCGESFIQKVRLKNHLIEHQGEYRLRCGLCMKGYDRRGELLGHIFCVHSAPTKQVKVRKRMASYDCEECGKSFPFKSNYQRHMSSHFHHLVLKCRKCNSVFLHQNQMVDHMNSAHAHISGNKFSELSVKDATLVTSMRKNVRKVRVQSLQKASPTDSSTDLPDEKVEQKGVTEVLQCGNVELQDTILKDCVEKNGKKSASNKLVIKRKRIDNKSAAHICSVCGKSFTCSWNLKDHVIRHKRKYLLRCGVCMKGFQRHSEIAGHMFWVHSSESSKTKEVLKRKAMYYVCEECGKTFSMKCHYKRHMGSHFHLSVFKCPLCDHVFPQQNQMLEHMKSAHENISANVFSELCVEDAKLERSVRKNVRKVPAQSLQNDTPKDVSHFDDSSTNIVTEGTGGKKEPGANVFQNDSPKDVSDYQKSSTALADEKVDQKGKTLVELCSNVELPDDILMDCTKQHTFKHNGTKRKRSDKGEHSIKDCIEQELETKETICEDTGEKSIYSPAEEASKGNKQCRPYLCHSCGQSFKQMGHLENHLITHTGKFPVKCALCKKGFRRPTEVIAHLHRCHRNIAEKTGNVSGYPSSYEQLFECGFCEKRLDRKDEVIRHLTMHRKSINEGLTNHELSSTSNMPVKKKKSSKACSNILNCDECGKDFVSVKSYFSHKCKAVKMTCPV